MRRGGEDCSSYRSIQIDCRQRLCLEGVDFQLQIQNRAARRINCHYRDNLWEFQQKTLITDTDSLLNPNKISIADTDFRLKTNNFSNNLGYNGSIPKKLLF